VIVLVFLRPDQALPAGFLFGLAVDLFGTRLFGVHCLAFCLLGPVATAVPVGAVRTRTEAVACIAGAQALTAGLTVTAAAAVFGGGAPPDSLGRLVQSTAWTLVVAVPLVMASGAHPGPLSADPAGLSGSADPFAGPADAEEWV